MSTFVPLPQAANQLGTTLGALRKRLQRGSIQGKKDSAGKWLVDVGHPDGHPVYLSYPKVDNQQDKIQPSNQREIENLQRENDRLNARYDQLMKLNEQLISQQENEQVLRRDMQHQISGMADQLGRLQEARQPLLEDGNRLEIEHKTLKMAVSELIKHVMSRK